MFPRISIVALSVAMLATPALAADLPARNVAPSPIYTPAPVYSWEGFYLGVDLGYAWQNARTIYGYVPANFSPSGIVGGAYAGYNFRVGSSFVLGLEGDIEGGAVKQSSNILGLATVGIVGGAPVWGNNISITNDFRGSVRGRAGVSFDRALLYATGGLAFANMNMRMSWGNAWYENWNASRAGWTLGAGLEYAFSPNWIGRAEYRFTSLGNFSRYSALAGYSISQRVDDHAIRIGLAYKWGGGYSTPVVAKY